MYFDAFTISALVDELMDEIVGGRVQKIIDTDEDGIGLEIYANRQRRYLYLSADHLLPRVQLSQEKLRRGLSKPTQLGLLLRRHVDGGVISHVSQPPFERVIEIEIDGAEGVVSLIIEPMERRSNVLLVQYGTILDCIRRVGPEDNRYRLSLPNHEYVPPPPQTGKLNPFELTLLDLETIISHTKDPKAKAFRAFASRILGFSPLVAKEVLFRATGLVNRKISEVDAVRVLEAMQPLVTALQNRQWQPGIVRGDDEVAAYSVYPLHHLDNWQPTGTISESINAFYKTRTGVAAYENAKKSVQKSVDEAKAKLTAKINSLRRSLRDETEMEQLRQSGELILAYQYSLEDDQTILEAQYEVDGPQLTIQLDPTLTPVENAERYFKNYNRSKRALQAVPKQITVTQNELAYIEQLESDLDIAANWNEIDEVMQALQTEGYLLPGVKRLGAGGRAGPKKLTHDGYVIWIGRNSRQNEIATFKHANPNDLWLHVRGVPGAHVIIRADGRSMPEELISQVAAIAAYYSKKRGDNKVPVDVTQRKYVRKIKGAGAGMVTYRNERTITVQPMSEEILKNE